MSTTKNSIVLIGAGNVATQLGLALHDAGYIIEQVYSRTSSSANSLAALLKTEAITDLKELNKDANVYIIAVKDDAIANIAKKLDLGNKIVAHTSGTVEMKVLKNVSKNIGVFYPLQTFSKNKKVNFREIPICVEGNNKSTSTSLQYFAKSISDSVQKIDSEQRKKLHLAAVFACNFSNHMYAIADTILSESKLPLSLLQPLIEETALKIKTGKPLKMQTGPAVRGDKETMKAQIKMLSKNKELKKIYSQISESIASAGKKNKS